MAKYGNCPYAFRPINANPVHCEIQQKQNLKWDFCTFQYFCRVTGRYEIKPEADNCNLKTHGG